MSTKTPILYLVYRDGLGPIFGSVYLRPAAMFARQGFAVRMVITSMLGDYLRGHLRQRWRKLGQTIKREIADGYVRLPAPPSRFRWWWYERQVLRHWLRLTYGRRQRVVLHCGGSFATVLALEARRFLPELRVVHQCWGPEKAEYLFHRAENGGEITPDEQREAEFRDHLQRRALREADATISISDAMTQFAVQDYGADPRRIIKAPCYVETQPFLNAACDRAAIREQLGLADRFVVTYCGSILHWQLPPGAFKVFHAVRRERSNAHFLAVTTNPVHMRRLLAEHGVADDAATVVSVPHHQVPRYLAAGDLGILGRGLMSGYSVVNGISSPVKYGEYLASGTPVVMSEGIGDFSELTRREGVGVVLPHHAGDEQMEQLVRSFVRGLEREGEALRTRCQDVARRHLDMAEHLPKIAGLYERLAAPGAAELNASMGVVTE